MNQISNQFTLTAIQSNITIQGRLMVDGSTTQNYNPVSARCIPDWKTTVAKRPKLYPIIRRSAAYLSDASINNKKWYYNGDEILFNDDPESANYNKSTNYLDSAGDPKFHRGTITKSLGGVSYTLPCLTIVGNLANAENVDLDIITFEGTVELNGTQVAFPPCSIEVKISQMTTQGYLGLLSPESAIIAQKGDKATIAASLLNESGDPVECWVTWKRGDGTAITADGTHIKITDTTGVNGVHTIEVDDEAVTDNLVLRCDFYTDSRKRDQDRVTTAFASVDDAQDPEYLFISLDGKTGDYSGQLYEGETVDVEMWVATLEAPTTPDTKWTNFAIAVYNGKQELVTEGVPTVTVTSNKGKATFSYQFLVNNCGGKCTGIVTATTAS